MEQGAPEPAKDKVPEFQKFKLKKVSVAHDRTKSEDQKVDDELMRKLDKQKKVAESEGNVIGFTSNIPSSVFYYLYFPVGECYLTRGLCYNVFIFFLKEFQLRY